MEIPSTDTMGFLIMEQISVTSLMKKIELLKKVVEQAWQAGYEQGMEDDFHKSQMPFKESMFYRENKQHFVVEENERKNTL